MILNIEVREDIRSTTEYTLWRAIVTNSRGRCFYAIYAGDEPSADKVRGDYTADKNTSRAKNWTPYVS